jgi:hypothetical protein
MKSKFKSNCIVFGLLTGTAFACILTLIIISPLHLQAKKSRWLDRLIGIY